MSIDRHHGLAPHLIAIARSAVDDLDRPGCISVSYPVWLDNGRRLIVIVKADA